MAGPDMDWVVEQLERFIQMATPHNLSRQGYATPENASAAPESQMLAEQDVIERILDRFYPTWRDDNAPSRDYEWQVHYLAARRCLGQIRRGDEIAEKLGDAEAPSMPSDRFHPWVWDAARVQWQSGHRAEAVDAAARNVNSRLQQRLGRRDISDANLVRQAFSLDPPAPGRPRIRLHPDPDSEMYRSLQEGAGSFGAGCFQVIRNPLAHLPDHEVDITEQEALERLAAFSLLARWIDTGDLDSVG